MLRSIDGGSSSWGSSSSGPHVVVVEGVAVVGVIVVVGFVVFVVVACYIVLKFWSRLEALLKFWASGREKVSYCREVLVVIGAFVEVLGIRA